MSAELLESLAQELREAEDRRVAVAPISERFAELTVADAYRIQQLNVHHRKDQGAAVLGRKVGLTSRAMQAALGVDQPDFGALLSTMFVEEGDDVRVDELLQPRVEAEIAFVMGHELRGPGVTTTAALAAVAGALPALEVIDSRIADWRISLIDTIADNASSARVVLGGRVTPIHELDLRLEGMALSVNGAPSATGAGAAVLGHPVRCVAWLANKLAEFGVPLRAGDVVMAGALHAAVPVAGGDVVRAEFANLGAVTTRFATTNGAQR